MSNVVKTLIVEGMTCSHCENSVKKAVGELDGVNYVKVELSTKEVTIEYNSDKLSEETIKETIEDQGYDVKI